MIMLFNKLLDMPHLWGEWFILGLSWDQHFTCCVYIFVQYTLKNSSQLVTWYQMKSSCTWFNEFQGNKHVICRSLMFNDHLTISFDHLINDQISSFTANNFTFMYHSKKRCVQQNSFQADCLCWCWCRWAVTPCCPSAGCLQRASCTGSSPQRVTCGVWAWSSGRSSPTANSPGTSSPTTRSVSPLS